MLYLRVRELPIWSDFYSWSSNINMNYWFPLFCVENTMLKYSNYTRFPKFASLGRIRAIFETKVSVRQPINNNNNNNNWFLYSAFLVWDTTQSALQCIITPVTGFNINPALIVHLLNSLGSILARCYFRGAHMPHHATNNVRILPSIHLYTWVESSNVDKVSCWSTKSARHWRESNPEPFDPESRVQSNIPRHLHIKIKIYVSKLDLYTCMILVYSLVLYISLLTSCSEVIAL